MCGALVSGEIAQRNAQCSSRSPHPMRPGRWPGRDKTSFLTRPGPSCGGMDDPIQLPVDGVLDLHTFRPSEVKDLVPDYLDACRERGILNVRIIHGKGIGHLRRTVHALLARHPAVASFALDYPEFSGWGATLVRLKPAPAAAAPENGVEPDRE